MTFRWLKYIIDKHALLLISHHYIMSHQFILNTLSSFSTKTSLTKIKSLFLSLYLMVRWILAWLVHLFGGFTLEKLIFIISIRERSQEEVIYLTLSCLFLLCINSCLIHACMLYLHHFLPHFLTLITNNCVSYHTGMCAFPNSKCLFIIHTRKLFSHKRELLLTNGSF